MGQARRESSEKREVKWREAVACQAASGLTVREFCEQNGLREPSFYAWRRTLQERDAQRQANEATGPAFLPVKLAPPNALPAPGFALEFPSGRILRLPESLSIERLAAIVRAIEGEVAP